MTQLTIISSEENVIAIHIDACRQSPVLRSIIELPRNMLDQLQPITFGSPTRFLVHVCRYLEKVARGELPKRATALYFSYTPAEENFMNIPISQVGQYAMAARMLGAYGFLHVLALKCACQMSVLPHSERKRQLGIDDTVPLELKNKRRSEIGKHILSFLGIFKS